MFTGDEVNRMYERAVNEKKDANKIVVGFFFLFENISLKYKPQLGVEI